MSTTCTLKVNALCFQRAPRASDHPRSHTRCPRPDVGLDATRGEQVPLAEQVEQLARSGEFEEAISLCHLLPGEDSAQVRLQK